MPLRFRWETEFKETEIEEIPKDWEVRNLGEILINIIKEEKTRKISWNYPLSFSKMRLFNNRRR